MSQDTTKLPATPAHAPADLDLERVRTAYSHWAQVAVDEFNQRGSVAPFMAGIKFLSGGRLECTALGSAYVAKTLSRPGGEMELGRFAASLLRDEQLRQNMLAEHVSPFDAVVFVCEIVVSEAARSKPSSEALLVGVHTAAALYRGVCPVANSPKKIARFGAMDPIPTKGGAFGPTPDRVVAAVLATRDSHDLHQPPAQMH
ncbi:hypothetical protein ACSFA0_26145 [Variovorax sp. LT1P1]|uniref:hypothetical protein n=1 Tax=Variovorax sp. LT1P1 TaxID=3443730 RepID=UPI003F45D9C4